MLEEKHAVVWAEGGDQLSQKRRCKDSCWTTGRGSGLAARSRDGVWKKEKHPEYKREGEARQEAAGGREQRGDSGHKGESKREGTGKGMENR